MSDDGGIVRFQRALEPETILASGPSIFVLRGDSEFIYAFSNDSLIRRSHSGKGDINVFVEPDAPLALTPRGILAANGRVYWTQRWGESAGAIDDHLASVSSDGTDYQVHGTLPYRLTPVGVVGGVLHFVGGELDNDIVGTASVSGSFSVTILADGRTAVHASAGVGSVWMLEPFGGGSSVARVPLAGGGVETIASIDEPVGLGSGGIAATAESVFWSSSGQLYGCRIAECEPVAIGEGNVDQPVVLAGDWLYWGVGNEVFGIPVR